MKRITLTLAQRNGAKAQTHRIYNTYTDASNYERGGIGWGVHAGNYMSLFTQAGGTGTARSIWINSANSLFFTAGGGGVGQWTIATSGHFLAGSDNTYDIGASGANRPRNLYVGSAINAGGNILASGDVRASVGLGLSGKGYFTAASDGVWRISNNALNDFNRLQLGGTTSSFPALKRSSTTLQGRLADDSAFCAVQGKITTDAAYSAGAPTPTGYVVIYDSTGTAYKIPAEAV